MLRRYRLMSTVTSQNIFISGDFSYLGDAREISMTRNAYDAVSQTEMWSWLKTYNPPAGEGFMFSKHPNVAVIVNKMEECSNPPGHSGASFGFIMRRMQKIAILGEEAYRIEYLAARQ